MTIKQTRLHLGRLFHRLCISHTTCLKYPQWPRPFHIRFAEIRPISIFESEPTFTRRNTVGSRSWQEWSSPAGPFLGTDNASRHQELCLSKDRNDGFGKSSTRLELRFKDVYIRGITDSYTSMFPDNSL